MKDSLGYSHSLGKIALLFVTAILCLKPSVAQTDLQVMVNGPWSYVTDSLHPDRIFLVAPASTHHKTYIFVGTNAADFPNQAPIVQAGLYTLDFGQRGTPITNPDGEGTNVCSAMASTSRVSSILAGNAPTNPPAPQPFVISLPKPDSYSTFLDPNGRFDGFSESKVYVSDQAHQFPKSVQPQLYTTWMVLHYGVTSFPNDVSATFPNGSNTTYTTTVSQPGISIVAGDPDKDQRDNQCDYVSLESLNGQTALWNLNNPALHIARRGHFPLQTLIPPGTQIHYHYDYSCSDDTPNMTDKWPGRAGGSADCHTCQLGINGAGPQPPPQ